MIFIYFHISIYILLLHIPFLCYSITFPISFFLVDQFKNKTIRLEVFLKQDISAFSSPMPSHLNSTLTGSMTPTAVLAAPSSSNNNSALITAAASSFVNSPSFSASPRTSLQTHSNKKVTFRPGPNSTISNLEASAAVAAAAAAANATSTLNSPQRTFRAPSTYHHRHQDSPSTLPSTPTANNAAILPESNYNKISNYIFAPIYPYLYILF